MPELFLDKLFEHFSIESEVGSVEKRKLRDPKNGAISL